MGPSARDSVRLATAWRPPTDLGEGRDHPDGAPNLFKRSTKRQVKCHWRIGARDEAITLIERLRCFIFCIHHERIGTNETAGIQASVNRTADQNLAQAGATTFNSACHSSYAKARYGVTRQFFTLRVTQLLNAYLCSAERVKTQDFARRRIINQNKDGANAFCILLGGVLVQEFMRIGNSTA